MASARDSPAPGAGAEHPKDEATPPTARAERGRTSDFEDRFMSDLVGARMIVRAIDSSEIRVNSTRWTSTIRNTKGSPRVVGKCGDSGIAVYGGCGGSNACARCEKPALGRREFTRTGSRARLCHVNERTQEADGATHGRIVTGCHPLGQHCGAEGILRSPLHCEDRREPPDGERLRAKVSGPREEGTRFFEMGKGGVRGPPLRTRASRDFLA